MMIRVDSPYMEWLLDVIFKEGRFEEKITEPQEWDLIKPLLSRCFNSIQAAYERMEKLPDFYYIKKRLIKKAESELSALHDFENHFLSLSFCE